MKKMFRKVMGLALATLLLSAMSVGCTKTTASTIAATDTSKALVTTDEVAETSKQMESTDLPQVAFICKSYSDSFCVWVKNEIEKRAIAYSDEFELVSFDSENNSNTQIDQINNAVASGFDVIIFQQVDAVAPVTAVKDAVAAGVAVIVTTGSINDNGESVYIDANPEQQGKALAEYAITLLPDNAKIAILQGPAGNFHANGRQAGFEAVLSTRDDIEIVDQQIGEWSKENALTITQNWLASIPDLDAIFAHNDDMALGAIEAIKMAGLEDQIQVFGIDATAGGCQAVESGAMGATVFQNAISYADLSLEYASQTLKGEVSESVRIDSELVTPDNVEKYIQIHKDLGNIK